MRRPLAISIYVMAGLVGLAALTYPLMATTLANVWTPDGNANVAPMADASLLTMVLLLICLGVLVIEAQGQAVNAKVIAALGILVAIASVLRLLETAIPGPGGFSPIFVPIILASYVYGARFGFLMGVLTMFTSALLTGGVGPWLPYQMFAAGWIGVTAGWLPKVQDRRLAILMLATFSFLWGLLYGAILNLYFWPMLIGDSATSWQAGLGISGTLARYGAFYLASSFAWDLVRGIGNIVLILAIGIPAVKALSRFRDRLRFELI